MLLLMLVAGTVAPVAALLMYSIYSGYAQAHEQAAQAALGLAQVTADSVEAFLADTRRMMSKVAARPAVRLMDRQRCAPVFSEFRDLYPQFADFSQVNLAGEVICPVPAPAAGRSTTVRDAAWFQRVVREQTFIVAAPAADPASGSFVSVLAHPVFDDAGRLVGSIQLPMDLVNFKPVVGSSKLPPSTVITIIDSAGTLVARSLSPERYVGRKPAGSPIIEEVLARHAGTSRSANSEGAERVFGYLPIPGTDWFAIVGTSADVVFKQARENALRNGLLGLLVIGFALAAAAVLRRRIVEPIRALRDTAQRVARGELEARAPIGGPAEIAAVAAQLNAMLDAGAAQVRALADSEADFRRLFENSLEGILRTGPGGSIVQANPAACEIFRLSEEQLLKGGRAAIFDSRDPRLQPLMDERARTGRTRGEVTMTRGDGSSFECAISSSTYTGADGRVSGNLFLRDLSDRIQKEEMRAGKEAAELASRAKSAFLARMSHELRTPLNAILGFAQLLEFEPTMTGSPKLLAMVGHVRTAGKHLLALVNEVLDLSRIETGAMSLSVEPVEVAGLVDECIALSASLAVRHGVTMHFDGAGAAASWIRGDRTRVRQVLVNVLGNAVKYNRAGGSVQVRLGGDAAVVEIAVQDTGDGLSAKQIANLFQPFNRLGAESSAVEGSGLGLVIVKQLLQAMDASIDVAGEPGRGSTFTLRFPRTATPEAPAAEPPAPAAVDGGERAAASAGPTLLYVEDNPANVALVREVLRLRPAWKLAVAADGEAGLAAAQRLRPDLILLDIHLPRLDGYQVMHRLRQDALLKAVPCIAVSANAMAGEDERARLAGFAGYLVKPFDVADLLARLDAWTAP